MRTFVAGKLHGITVTDASVDYHGSVGISRELLDAAGIHPFERVSIVNLNNGERWDTYTLALDEPGQFTLNGGSAHLGLVGDRCVIMVWQTGSHMYAAPVAFVDERNQITRLAAYTPGGELIDRQRDDEPIPGQLAIEA